jgi:hypothetical protein
LPLDFSATKFIANSLWLDDFERFEVTSQLAVLFCNETGEVLTDFSLGERSSNFWNVDVDNLSVLCIDNGTKVEWK